MSRPRTLLFTAALLAVLLPACSPPAFAGAGEGVSFIAANQAPDGGFTEPGRTAGADSTTAWCVMALRAGGVDPHQLVQGGRSPLDFLASQAANWRSVTDYERTLLAVAAAGEDVRSFAGVDLVAKVQSFQRAGGNIGDAVNSNAFGMLAYSAAGIAVPAGAVDWHVRNQNGDGGWGNSPGAASNPDMTAASVMALRAAGMAPGEACIGSALGYLHSIQNADGGFSFQPGSSDVSATAWCVQAIVAAGQDPAGAEWSKNGNTPYGFVASMQAPDGRFYWMAGTDKNPVWTTAYAVCALARKPFPIGISYPAPPPATQEKSGNEAGAVVEPSPASPAAGGQGGGEETAPPASGGSADGGAEAAAEEGERRGMEKMREEDGEKATVSQRQEAGGGGDENAASSKTSFLVWFLPLVIALPLLSWGGWRLYRRYG